MWTKFVKMQYQGRGKRNQWAVSKGIFVPAPGRDEKAARKNTINPKFFLAAAPLQAVRLFLLVFRHHFKKSETSSSVVNETKTNPAIAE
jgi:hypothetical protein